MWAYQPDMFSVCVYSLKAPILRNTRNKTFQAANPGAVQKGIDRGDILVSRCKLGRLWYHLPSVKAGTRRENASAEQGLWSNDLSTVQQSNSLFVDMQEENGLHGDSFFLCCKQK